MEMQKFVHLQNIEHYRTLLAEAKDEKKRQMLAKLLSEEEAKEPPAKAE